jgi:2-phospho-L-lactate guanylyltransferase
MPTLVVPFRGVHGKSRLGLLGDSARAVLAEAMAADVVAAAAAVGPAFVVAPAPFDSPATHVLDPGRGQGAAVQTGLDAAVAAGARAPYLVVNADLPCVRPRDLLALAGAVPPDGIAVAPAEDGTTNALGLASVDLFRPLYGPGSAERFAGLAPAQLVEAPNLMDDVDTIDDLARVAGRAGSRTRRVLETLRVRTAA